MSKINNPFSLPQVSVPDPFQAATYGRDYIDFGVNNLYPNYLADLVGVSPTHAAIIETKTALLNASLEFGDGVDIGIDLENVDGNGSGIEDFIVSVFTNLGMYDGAYIEVIYNKARTRIIHMNVIPFEAVRVGRYNELGKIDTVYVSPDWSRKYIKRNKPVPMATFNTDSVDTDSQVIIVRTKKPNQPYYPIPGWVSAMQWILLEDDIAEYSRNSILNGFTPSTMFNFHNGEPTETDKSSMESYIKTKFTGKNSTKFMMFFDNDKEKSVDITQLQVPDLARYWESISPIVSEKIFTGHKIYPSLVGVPVKNGFSSNAEELSAHFQVYLKSSVIPIQKLVINVLRVIARFNKPSIPFTAKFNNELLVSEDDNKEDAANAEIGVDKKKITNPVNDQEDDK